jgi:hypothetical protein
MKMHTVSSKIRLFPNYLHIISENDGEKCLQHEPMLVYILHVLSLRLFVGIKYITTQLPTNKQVPTNNPCCLLQILLKWATN